MPPKPNPETTIADLQARVRELEDANKEIHSLRDQNFEYAKQIEQLQTEAKSGIAEITRLKGELQKAIEEIKANYDLGVAQRQKLDALNEKYETALLRIAELEATPKTDVKISAEGHISTESGGFEAIEKIFAELESDVLQYLDSHGSTSNTDDAAAITSLLRDRLAP